MINTSDIVKNVNLDKFTESPYKWDGSSLGVLQDDNIINDTIDPHTNMKYWTITIWGYVAICSYRISENASICIYDEAMEIFNLPKMGSHHVIYEKKLYILLKSNILRNGLIQSTTLLSTLVPTTLQYNLIEKIRIVYTVRDILGIYHTTDSDIIIIFTKIPSYPDLVISMKSYISNHKILQNNTSTITQTAIDKWYTDRYTGKIIDVREVYKLIFPSINDLDGIPIYTNDFKDKLDRIIERVDKSFCFISNLIVSRLTNRLARMLNYGK